MGAVESHEPSPPPAAPHVHAAGQSCEHGRRHHRQQQQHEQTRRYQHQISPVHPSFDNTSNDDAAPPSYDEAIQHLASTDPLLGSDWNQPGNRIEAHTANRQPYPSYAPRHPHSAQSSVAADADNSCRSGYKSGNRATPSLSRQELQRYENDGPSASTSSTPVLPVTTASSMPVPTRSQPNMPLHSQPYTSPLPLAVGHPNYGSMAPSLSSEAADGGMPPYQIIQIHHYGLCAAGGDHALQTEFTLPGILCALGCFPCGVACCLCMTERRCVKCGARFD